MRKKILTSLGCVLIATVAVATTGRPWLGMGMVLRNDESGGKFLYAAHVPEGTPAYLAGARRGDVITAFDGKPITFRDDLDVLEFLGTQKPGTILKVTIVREGKKQDFKVKLGMLPAEYEQRWLESLERAREMRKNAE